MKVILLLLIFLCGFEKNFAQDQILFKAKKVQSAPGQSYEPGELLIQGPKIFGNRQEALCAQKMQSGRLD